MADEKTQIVGVWKLVSVMYEDQETKTLTPIMGDNPRGYQIATPDGRWLALATPTGRTAPTTDEERAQAFRTMIGYSGRYRVEGSTITTKVDVAWNEIMGWRRTGAPHPIRRRQAVHRKPADAASQHVRQDGAGDRCVAARRLVSHLNAILRGTRLARCGDRPAPRNDVRATAFHP